MRSPRSQGIKEKTRHTNHTGPRGVPAGIQGKVANLGGGLASSSILHIYCRSVFRELFAGCIELFPPQTREFHLVGHARWLFRLIRPTIFG